MVNDGRSSLRLVAAAVVIAVATLGAGVAAHAGTAHERVVQERPSQHTPHVMDGAVNAIVQVGDLAIAGGDFSQVQDPSRTHSYPRGGLVAFNAKTGAINASAPRVNGQVWALEPSADGTGVYVAGRFTQVDGQQARGVFLWDLTRNRIDPTFRPTVTLGRVSDIQLVNGRLFASGWFSKRLVALDPVTGADTGYVNLSITGDLGGPDDGWLGQVYRFAMNPARDRMIVIGNFTGIEGIRRNQIAMLNLGSSSATLSTWYSSRWNETCHRSTPWYTRDVDWSPDGTYFAVVTTGGPFPRTSKLCDTTTKWMATANPGSQPTWVNHTGGMTLHSVAVTGAAIYVAGHQLWLDNPYGDKSRGPGAVERPGIGAIDQTTGRALPWNPGKSRGQGAKELYVTPDGLWVGSDTTRFAGQYRARIAFVPL
jgi:hypothetical protein